MKDADIAACWDQNAEAWTVLTRAGGDVCRDAYNTPAFLELLPDVEGLKGLDVGCGEGHNTRLVAQQGARMAAIDLSEKLIEAAQATEEERPLGIRYLHANAKSLPFANESFDFVMSTMCLMDFPQQEEAVAEISRILKPGGFFQFSITHPCTNTPVRYWIKDEEGNKTALATSSYFTPPNGDIEEWIFGNAPENLKSQFPKFEVPRFHKTLSDWINLIADAGFRIEQTEEPKPDLETLEKHPREYDALLAPYFLIFRCRKDK